MSMPGVLQSISVYLFDKARSLFTGSVILEINFKSGGITRIDATQKEQLSHADKKVDRNDVNI